jgi:hypothetical protein
MRNKLLIFSLLTFISHIVSGQENNIRIGRWRVHLPYNDLSTVAVGQSKVYTANGSSIFNLDKDDNSININSKYTGLNDVLVSRLGYNASEDTYIIGYQSGNIDLVKGNVITNANDIVRFTNTGSKKINHILSKKEFAYISGDYGVVLYDVSKKEVKESYLTLTSDFSANPVYASALNNDSIYLATSKGVMKAKVAPGVNLMDFNNWYTFQASDSIDTLNVVSVCAHGGIIYAAVMNQGIYYYNGSKWRKTTVPVTGGGNIRSLTKCSNGILACVDTAVFKITSGSSWTVVYYQNNISPSEAYYDSDKTLWISTLGGGLVQNKNNNINNIYPNGPLTNKAFRFGYYNNNIVGLTGGYNSIAQRVYFGNWWCIFENNTSWVEGQYKYPSIPSSFGDFVGATYNPSNGTLYLSSYGNGLIAIGPDQSVKKYNNINSPLILSNTDLLVGETAVDKDGNLWVTNHVTSSGLSNFHKLSSDGIWDSFLIPSALSKNAISVTIDDYDNKWIRASAPSTEVGIVVFNEKTNKSRTLSNSPGQGDLPDINVNCITKDKKGTMFVGTNQGIAVCYDPFSILNPGSDLITPIFEGFPILYERNVLSIEVDGGNRKWVGTNDGLWLFNEDLTKVIEYFDTDNSPLLSDYVMDIQIHELSGEVFFATQEGIVSYRGTATEGDDKYSDVKVFPNPVKPDFKGLVGISGLATDASVKITDVAGNLVYETTAEGGTAVWNVKDYNGKRAATGVYLIFCATADGSNKFVSKIAVVE